MCDRVGAARENCAAREKPIEIIRQRGRGGITGGRFFLETFQANRFEVRRNFSV